MFYVIRSMFCIVLLNFYSFLSFFLFPENPNKGPKQGIPNSSPAEWPLGGAGRPLSGPASPARPCGFVAGGGRGQWMLDSVTAQGPHWTVCTASPGAGGPPSVLIGRE